MTGACASVVGEGRGPAQGTKKAGPAAAGPAFFSCSISVGERVSATLLEFAQSFVLGVMSFRF